MSQHSLFTNKHATLETGHSCQRNPKKGLKRPIEKQYLNKLRGHLKGHKEKSLKLKNISTD